MFHLLTVLLYSYMDYSEEMREIKGRSSKPRTLVRVKIKGGTRTYRENPIPSSLSLFSTVANEPNPIATVISWCLAAVHSAKVQSTRRERSILVMQAAEGYILYIYILMLSH